MSNPLIPNNQEDPTSAAIKRAVAESNRRAAIGLFRQSCQILQSRGPRNLALAALQEALKKSNTYHELIESSEPDPNALS